MARSLSKLLSLSKPSLSVCVISYENFSNKRFPIKKKNMCWPISLLQLHLPIPPSSITSHRSARILAGIQGRGDTVNNKAQTTGADGLLYCPQKCKQWMSLLGGLRHSASSGYGMITAATWHRKLNPDKLRENTKITKKLLRTTVPWIL